MNSIFPVGFAIQTLQTHLDKEQEAIALYSILNKIPYKFCKKPKDVPEGYIPCGNVEWVENFISKEKTIPDYYPEFLKDHLFRNVWKTDKWPIGQKVFIKPADRYKRFDGKITNGSYKGKKKSPYWCSDIVKFTNEWRYYVSNGKILTSGWYSGDEVNTPDAPELSIDLPENYCGCLDFGTLTTGELALVEANSPYACGWEYITK